MGNNNDKNITNEESFNMQYEEDLKGIKDQQSREFKKLPFEERERITRNILINEIKLTNSEAFDNAEWIIITEDSKGKQTIKINCPILANHIMETQNLLFVRDAAMNAVLLYLYRDGYYNMVSDNELKGFILKYIPLKLQKTRDSKEVLELLYQHAVYTSIELLDPEKYINFNDCLFNIEEWKCEPHSPKVYNTIRIMSNCPYITEFIKPENSIFDKYLDDLTENDAEKRSVILQFMGVAFSNICGYRLKKSLFMVGPGDTGKSKIKELISRILGKKYCSSMDLADLEERFSTSQLNGKRLVGSNDMSFLTVKELKTFKKIVGGDDIPAEYKGMNKFDFIFKGVAWFCCNKLPKFGGDKGDWVYNRIVILNCNNVIPEEKRIKNIVELMLNEIDYIIYLALEELRKVIKNNYSYILPDESKEALNEYKVENNSFLKFFNECTKERQEEKIKDSCSCKKLYDVYAAWCKDNNNGFKETKNEVRKHLKSIEKDKRKTIHGVNYWSQFTLTYDTKLEYKLIYGYDGHDDVT